MTVGAITAELQAAAPEIWEAIDEAGQDVTIRCPGLPDAVARAVLYQFDDNERQSSVDHPEFKVQAWQGIFKPDAPVRQIPFTVIDQRGRMFVPDGPPQDPVEQGVALIVHLSPAPERTRVSQLTFTLPGSGLVRDPKTGNMVPAPGPQITVPVRLVASDDPRIRDMVGADAASVALIGRWGTFERPMLKPAGLNWGSTSPLILDGQPGVLTLKLAYPDPDLMQEQQLGARFVASWKAGV